MGHLVRKFGVGGANALGFEDLAAQAAATEGVSPRRLNRGMKWGQFGPSLLAPGSLWPGSAHGGWVKRKRGLEGLKWLLRSFEPKRHNVGVAPSKTAPEPRPVTGASRRRTTKQVSAETRSHPARSDMDGILNRIRWCKAPSALSCWGFKSGQERPKSRQVKQTTVSRCALYKFS